MHKAGMFNVQLLKPPKKERHALWIQHAGNKAKADGQSQPSACAKREAEHFIITGLDTRPPNPPIL